MSEKWEFCRAAYWDLEDPSDPNKDFEKLVRKQKREWEQLLNDGWEPIGAHTDRWGYMLRSWVWLRRKKRP